MTDRPVQENPDMFARDVGHDLGLEVYVRVLGDEHKARHYARRARIPGPDRGAAREDLLNPEICCPPPTVAHCPARHAKGVAEDVRHEMRTVVVAVLGEVVLADIADMLSQKAVQLLNGYHRSLIRSNVSGALVAELRGAPTRQTVISSIA